MADTVKVTGLPDSGSKERVALDLARWIATGEQTVGRKAILDLYAECLIAANGYRKTT